MRIARALPNSNDKAADSQRVGVPPMTTLGEGAPLNGRAEPMATGNKKGIARVA